MSINRNIGQPMGKIVMTNIAVVRMRKAGKRFEVAAYKNKVLNWRNGVETDLDEVLQIAKVYENVSKGKFAKKQDWSKAFGMDDEEEVCKVILNSGELQVSEGERKAQVENTYRDIASIVADKCVNPTSNRPYPASVIERLMKEIHFGVVPNRSAKQQALEVIKRLESHVPIARAKMKVQISAPLSAGSAIKEGLHKEHAEVVEEDWSDPLRFVVLITPGTYRNVDALVQQHGAGNGSLEVIDLSVHKEGEHSIDAELTRKTEQLQVEDKSEVQQTPVAPEAKQKSDKKKCSTCGGAFDDVQAYREHFRSQWHRYNLKLKSSGQTPVNEETFNALSKEEMEQVFKQMS